MKMVGETYEKNNGISLIILVITIIVILILAGAIILSLSTNNPINSASEAAFKSKLETYKSELALYLSNEYAKTGGTLDVKSISASKNYGNYDGGQKITDIIKSMMVEDSSSYIIYQGELKYLSGDTNTKLWASNLGDVSPYITSGLVMWLDGIDFSNASKTGVWIDRSGTNNNAYSNNFQYTNTSGSDGNGGVALDGVDDYFKITNNSSLLPADVTFSMLVKANNWLATTANCLIIKRAPTCDYFMFAYYGGNLSFDWGGSPRWESVYSLPTNTWISITITKSSTKKSIYINGVLILESTAIAALPLSSSDVYIGADVYGNRYYLNGTIRNVLMYNRSLTATEVTQNYNVDKIRYGL